MSQSSTIQQLDDQRNDRYHLEDWFRLNIDNSGKKAVTIFWGIFVFFLIAIFYTRPKTAPEAFLIKNNRSELQDTHHQNCTNPVTFYNEILSCIEFSLQNPRIGLLMKGISPLNQFIQINLIVIPKANQSLNGIKQTLDVELMSLRRKLFDVNENKKAIVFQKGEDVKVLKDFQFQSSNYQLQDIIQDDNIKIGYEIGLGYYREFKTEDALLVIKFTSADANFIIGHQIYAQAVLMNKNYTIFMIVMRGIFLGITTLTLCYFYLRLRKQQHISVQQKAVLQLSIGVIFFNDPYYFIGVFIPNMTSVLLSTLFLTSFLILLLLTWCYLLIKIQKQTKGQIFTLTCYQKAFAFLISSIYFIVIFSFNIKIGYYAYQQAPIIPAHLIFGWLFKISVILFALIFAYIAWRYFKILQNCDKMIWRNKVFISFNVFFIAILLIFTSLGWFSLYDESSQKFQIFYASFNLYVIYLQYMYTSPIRIKSQKLNQQYELAHSTIIDEKIEGNCVTIDLEPEFRLEQEEQN